MLDRILPVLGGLVVLAYTIASLVAFSDGVEKWFDWPLIGWKAFAVAGIFVLVAMFRLTVPTLPFVFYGAWQVWHLTWWQALAFTVPALALGAMMLLGSSVMAIWDRLCSVR